MTMHFEFQKKTYAIKISKSFLLFCASFFILFCILGIWQLHRYQYKKNLVFIYEQRMNALPRPFMLISGSLNDLQFQPIAVDGDFVNELTVLIQNRFYKQQSGFEVLTPLRIAGQKKLLLVDRGWIKKSELQMLPSINYVAGQQHITGYLKLLGEYQFILGDNILEPNKKPLVIQKIDIEEIGRITRQTYYPFILRLDSSHPNGFVRDWVISATLPERHMMYAMQWFAMAIVLIIAHFSFCLERVRKS